jgi:hypothetical protein
VKQQRQAATVPTFLFLLMLVAILFSHENDGLEAGERDRLQGCWSF